MQHTFHYNEALVEMELWQVIIKMAKTDVFIFTVKIITAYRNEYRQMKKDIIRNSCIELVVTLHLLVMFVTLKRNRKC